MVGGRYELGELLGRGGMAEVRKGHDTRLGRVVAIKRLRTDLASDPTFQARFRREAQSAASLNHPAIVAVYDTGEEPATDGSETMQPYIVMEYVAGRTLRDILREGRKILPERALEITSGVLSALDYSHRAGIIHRDIKPGNVMLTPSGDVKVMDFGIARAMSDSHTMTQTAAVVGTAQYLSPEQARGETVDSRSDVYSAGCLLYELLTGRPPFVGDSPVAVAYQHVREPARPPSDHDTDLPPAVDAIVMKSLAKRLEDRYQSAAAMRADIERYLAGRPVQAPVPVPAPVPPPVPPPADDTSTAVRPPVPPPVDDDDYERDRGGPRTLVLVLLGLLVVALIVGAWLALRSDLFESAPEQVQVPNVIGMTEDEARNAIGDAGLTVDAPDFQPDETVESGHVIDQDPNRDQYVDPGTSVHLTISSGLPQAEVPFLVGSTQDEARTRLRDAKLKPEFKSVESDEPQGRVLQTEPEGGTEVDQGSTVTVTISKGPHLVPNVVGLNRSDAIQQIVDAGFAYDIRGDDKSTEPRGTVTDQLPPAGQPQPQGTTIVLFVSTYEPPPPPPTTVPPTVPPTETPTETPTPRISSDQPPGRVAGTRSASHRTGPAGRRTPAR
ncbi:MAG TPA: Stk1 family PASTA domain-containing Ser/Thr kinase [Nocardioides sp.]|uniref:Stk1 family PASTA domain-containing Ser/Thr kinase n=1 Tax=Nocardioides sp. TaxID=35761 RepID=UPI002E30C570|nr:Stk1 family PASTA domain-containing Ser/Thr kinase [Nocardioides sp.]HEX5089745.1 Stk1 family PASTA domain-containing Ser/Thr kinase [Nocardioides sp.]